MDTATLASALEVVAPACGATLSVDERVAVETSLALLKSDNVFDKVFFWGRISGIQNDYLIAQGYNLPYAMVEATSSPASCFYRCARRHRRRPRPPSACSPSCVFQLYSGFLSAAAQMAQLGSSWTRWMLTSCCGVQPSPSRSRETLPP